MPATVSISNCDHYESEAIRRALDLSLGPLGGIGRFVQKGQRVLLKPNFVLARRAEEAANTHPNFVVEVARLVREAGGEPVIGDSPALGSARGVAAKCGLLPLAKDAGVSVVDFHDVHQLDSPRGGRTKPVRIATDVLDANVVINLPKLKVHGQFYMTLAVKNLFGCVRGRRKALLHFQLGGRPIEFARMLVDVAQTVQPALTIMDAVYALERTGPTGGDPRRLGLVIAGTDPSATDRVCSEIVGADPERILTLAAARDAGFGETELKKIDLFHNGMMYNGSLPSLVPSLADRPFVLREFLIPLTFSPWQVVRGLVRQAWARLRPAQKQKA